MPADRDEGKIGNSKSSNGSNGLKNIPHNTPRLFSWEASPNPERRVLGSHTPTDSTVHTLP